jgi:hypothetical protein
MTPTSIPVVRWHDRTRVEVGLAFDSVNLLLDRAPSGGADLCADPNRDRVPRRHRCAPLNANRVVSIRVVARGNALVGPQREIGTTAATSVATLDEDALAEEIVR